MKSSNDRYSKEDLMELGRMNVEEGVSVRELARKVGVSKSTASKAKEAYKAYREGKRSGEDEKEREMEEEISRLESRIEDLSARPGENTAANSSSIDLEDYAMDPDQNGSGGEKVKESGWGWVALGLGAMVTIGGLIFRNYLE